jgi:uncharacterized membrane protein
MPASTDQASRGTCIARIVRMGATSDRRQWPELAALVASAGVAAAVVAMRRLRQDRRSAVDTLERGVGIRLIESVTINRPAAELFELWRDLPSVRVVHQMPPETISWQSPAKGPIHGVGSVRFTPLTRGGTQVSVALQHRTPFARWVSRSQASRLREDLRRLKRWLEAGEEPTTDGQPSGRRSALFRLFKDVAA